LVFGYHQARPPKQPKMVRQIRLPELQRPPESAYGLGAFEQLADDPATRRAGEGRENMSGAIKG
jgi:hypothetical protein